VFPSRLAVATDFLLWATNEDSSARPRRTPVPDRPVPDDAPPGLNLSLLGGNFWLTDRRFFLADDGSVWCREVGYAVFARPRWRAVLPAEQGMVVLNGRTLAELVAERLDLPPQPPPPT
jgi:hypothetical protein